MLKALLLDLDETLCDTEGANAYAKQQMADSVKTQFDTTIDGETFTDNYITGIYRDWTAAEHQRYMPIIEQQSEGAFRIQLIIDLLAARGINNVNHDVAKAIQDQFDEDRINAFDFYPGIVDFLAEARQLFTLVVITNGPVFSQVPKVETIKLTDHVDHIIIGGQEPEQKPAASIFHKALKLAGCEAHEAIHIGDSLKTDIAGALNMGITSLWVQHQQPLDAELGINPHHTVLHPSEIPAAIQRLHQNK